MRRLKLTVAYDGTDFVGWQRQNNGPTIQAELEIAVAKMTNARTHVQGAGRTDSGVHALAQVAHFDTETDIPLRGFLLGLNSALPRSIAVRAIEEAPPEFHARFSTKGKLYRYRIRTENVRLPETDRYEWQIGRPLDVAAMQAATHHLVGQHDFAAFRAADCDRKTTVRTLKRLEVIPTETGVLVEAEGPGFLKNMVRILAGTLVDVGLHRTQPDDLARIRDDKDRTRAGMTTPPEGLTLVRVDY